MATLTTSSLITTLTPQPRLARTLKSQTFPPKFFLRPRNQPSICNCNNPNQTKRSPLNLHGPQSSKDNLSPKRVFSTARQERVIIPNKEGEKLVGILHDTGSKEIVVVCHGLTLSKEEKTIVNLATGLEAEGISAYRFDFSGNGESEGSSAYGNFTKEADIDAVVKHFNGDNRVVSAVVGHSKGGDDVLLYASKYHDVRAIVNVSARFDMKRGIAESLGEDYMETLNKEGHIDVKKGGEIIYRVTKASMMERLNTNMHEASQKIGKECRVFTVHGSADEINPVEDAHEFAKLIPNHKLHIVEGADHFYNNHQKDMVSVVVDFIKACIQQDK